MAGEKTNEDKKKLLDRKIITRYVFKLGGKQREQQVVTHIKHTYNAKSFITTQSLEQALSHTISDMPA